MKTTPHPPHSPDLAPSDFSLFDHITECLARLLFENSDELLEMTWQAVFLEWMERLRNCLAPKGEYVESSKIDLGERLPCIHTHVRCSHMRGTPWP
jgi:hypothetical protein